MKTSEKFKLFRQQRGLSQEKLGQMIGVQKAAVNKYESGRVVNIKHDTLMKLAEALEVLPSELLDYDDEEQFIVRIEQDKMSPTIQKGDEVLIVKQSQIIDGKIHYIQFGGDDPYLARVHQQDRDITVSFDDKWRGAPLTIRTRDLKPGKLQIFGIAKKLSRNL